jgi:hypothetical protein
MVIISSGGFVVILILLFVVMFIRNLVRSRFEIDPYDLLSAVIVSSIILGFLAYTNY